MNKFDRQRKMDRKLCRLLKGRVHPRKKGPLCGQDQRDMCTKIMLLTGGNCIPCGNVIVGASPHEVDLVEPLLANRMIRRWPHKLIYDKAADKRSALISAVETKYRTHR